MKHVCGQFVVETTRHTQQTSGNHFRCYKATSIPADQVYEGQIIVLEDKSREMCFPGGMHWPYWPYTFAIIGVYQQPKNDSTHIHSVHDYSLVHSSKKYYVLTCSWTICIAILQYAILLLGTMHGPTILVLDVRLQESRTSISARWWGISLTVYGTLATGYWTNGRLSRQSHYWSSGTLLWECFAQNASSRPRTQTCVPDTIIWRHVTDPRIVLKENIDWWITEETPQWRCAEYQVPLSVDCLG